jgi:hypothetical protein
MLVGIFLFSGDQEGIAQKNRVRPYVVSRGLSPQNKEVLHDTLQSITEYSFRQIGVWRDEAKEPRENVPGLK